MIAPSYNAWNFSPPSFTCRCYEIASGTSNPKVLMHVIEGPERESTSKTPENNVTIQCKPSVRSMPQSHHNVHCAALTDTDLTVIDSPIQRPPGNGLDNDVRRLQWVPQLRSCAISQSALDHAWWDSACTSAWFRSARMRLRDWSPVLIQQAISSLASPLRITAGVSRLSGWYYGPNTVVGRRNRRPIRGSEKSGFANIEHWVCSLCTSSVLFRWILFRKVLHDFGTLNSILSSTCSNCEHHYQKNLLF